MSRIFTVKATVGERQMAFAQALKAVDVEKENRTKAMVKAVMDWLAEDCEENKNVKPLNNAN